ncbi:protein-tyrosine sulfotransferase 2-like isoform X1 [Daphnia carinata]|uniref:protein-tyrosine sulfotransferase 2-like isoform X1 n=1 Tax=Daphnia carinata TaxID=120202 RepID=UPI00257F56FC|nr:protein-tyrosine sulfotransferase 2-like isoform X1 [Daphnia carinata]
MKWPFVSNHQRKKAQFSFSHQAPLGLKKRFLTMVFTRGVGVKRILIYGIPILILIMVFQIWKRPCNSTPFGGQPLLQHIVVDAEKRTYSYDRMEPMIFIGGMPRSGTTLARVLLDAHPDIRCGEETRVLPRLLQMRAQWVKSQKEKMRLEEAGVTAEVLNSAIAAFIVEIVAKHGEPAKRLCNKDPFTMKSAVYLSELFPRAKFVLMVRDGRATVHSIITRKVTITGFDLTSYRDCLTKWNKAVTIMHNECQSVGPSRCLMVHYEQLVLHPQVWMEKILQFLDVPWDDVVLHHEQLINRPGGISLSKVERSSDQVVKPINLEALSKWVGQIPADVIRDMPDIAPMLSTFGYDPRANPPNYGDADQWVANNTLKVAQQERHWMNKTQELLKAKKQQLSHDEFEDKFVD